MLCFTSGKFHTPVVLTSNLIKASISTPIIGLQHLYHITLWRHYKTIILSPTSFMYFFVLFLTSFFFLSRHFLRENFSIKQKNFVKIKDTERKAKGMKEEKNYCCLMKMKIEDKTFAYECLMVFLPYIFYVKYI